MKTACWRELEKVVYLHLRNHAIQRGFDDSHSSCFRMPKRWLSKCRSADGRRDPWTICWRLENRKKCHFRPIKAYKNARVLNCSASVGPPLLPFLLPLSMAVRIKRFWTGFWAPSILRTQRSEKKTSMISAQEGDSRKCAFSNVDVSVDKKRIFHFFSLF